MQNKPRVGLVLMRSEGLRCMEPGEMRDQILSEERGILAGLALHFEMAGPWVVDSLEGLQACQNALRDTQLDLVLLAYQTWAEDSLLASLLPAIGDRPLVVWCYLPWRRPPRPASFSELQRTSGLVGAFAALGTLRNLGASFLAGAAGGYLTAWVAAANPMVHVLALGLILLALAALSALQMHGQQPIWYQLAQVAVAPMGVLAGGLVRLRVLGIL